MGQHRLMMVGWVFFKVSFSFREESGGNDSKREHRTSLTLFAITDVDHSEHTHTHTYILINSLYTDIRLYLQGETEAMIFFV